MRLNAKSLGFLLPAAISIGLLFVIYRRTDPGTLLDNLGRVDLFWASMYVVLSALEPALRGIRWSLLVPPSGPACTVKGLYIAKAGNNLLPLRMGDAIRAQFIRDKVGVPYSRSAASILAESALDLIFLGGIVFLFAIFMASKQGLLLAAGLLVCIPLLVFAAVKSGRMFQGKFFRTGPFAVVMKVAHHLKLMVSGSNRLALLASTAVLWGFTLLTSYCGLRMFLPEVSLLGVLAAIVFVYFSVLIPSAPGFVGTYHAAVAGSMAVMGYSLSLYPAAPIAIHLLQFLPQTAIGLLLGLRYIFANDWGKAWSGLKAARDGIFRSGEAK